MLTRKLRVKSIRMANGERLPILFGQDGQPIFESMLYVLTELRARNRAANTIENALRALLVFYLFLNIQKIDIRERLNNGEMLTINEIDLLVKLSRCPTDQLSKSLDIPKRDDFKSYPMESFRGRMKPVSSNEISSASVRTRLGYIRDYLRWLAADAASKFIGHREIQRLLMESSQRVNQAINSRLPGKISRSNYRLREGLEEEAINRLMLVVHPESNENPWKDAHCKYRNYLMILWFFFLGCRRGELLNIRVSQVDFRNETVLIARSPDDPEDPRDNQPLVKTRERVIPMSEVLLNATEHYIFNYRSSLPKARKHDFLFVANSGEPLSLPSVNKLFKTLRSKCPDLPRDLTPHVLRHTWNDRFSQEMEERNVDEEAEKKARSYLMGWSETSDTAATYTRRYVRKKAQKVSLEMQEKMLMQNKDNSEKPE